MPEVTRTWRLNTFVKPLAPDVIAGQAEEHDWPMDWHGLVNGLTVPRGRRCGEAHFLIQQSDLASLQNGEVTIECYHGLSGKKPTVTSWPGWYVESYQAVTKQGTPAYWVKLCDVRWLLEKSSCEGARFNLLKGDTPEYVDDTINTGTPYTWAQVVQALWSYLPGVAGSVPSLPRVPSTTPENLVFDGIGAWKAINQVLTAIGCCIVRNPFSGAFTIVDLTQVQSGLTATLASLASQQLLWHDHAGATDFAMPQKAGVLFHQLPDASSDYAPHLLNPFYEEATIGGTQGKYEIVDTMFYYSGRGAAITTRATEIAASLAGLLDPRVNPFGAVYSGIGVVSPGSRVSSVRWVSDGARGMQTMVFYEHSEIEWPKLYPYNNSTSISGAVVFTLTSNLARATGSTATATVVVSGVAGVSVSDAITVYNHGGGKYGPSGAHGYAQKVGDQYWVIEVNQAPLFVTFTFSSNTHGSSGTFAISDQAAFTISGLATLTPYPFSKLPASITVANPYNLIALTGDNGVAVYDVATGEYRLLDVFPLKSRRFYFELSADWPNGLDQTSTNATLIYVDPTHHGGNTDWSSFTLRDRFNLASNAKGTGATLDIGICQLNYKSGQFDILHITHVCWRGRGNVYASFTDTPDTFTVDSVVGFDGRAPAGATLTVYNELDIPNMHVGDSVEIRWNSIEGRYYALAPGNAGIKRWFVLAEDIASSDQEEVRVWFGELDGGAEITRSGGQTVPVVLVNVNFCLSPVTGFARAGYSGMMVQNPDGDSRWVISATYGCLNTCTVPSGYDIEQPTFPDATDGVSYGPETIVVTEVDVVTVEGLPDGLTFDDGTFEISGTPTESGTFWITISGDAGGCTITRLAPLTVLEP